MKSLVEYIYEQLITEASGELKPFKKTVQSIDVLKLLERGFNGLKNELKEPVSLGNKQDVKKLFVAFLKRCTLGSELDARKKLREYGVYSDKDFAKWITLNAEIFNKEFKNLSNLIKQFNETERERQYKAYKNSEDYVEGKKFDKEAYEEDDDDEERVLVIYDCNDPANPDTTLEYPFKGKRGKDNEFQVTMCKVDWHYQTGLKFFDARPILAQNYIKMGKDQLKKYIIDTGDDLR